MFSDIVQQNVMKIRTNGQGIKFWIVFQMSFPYHPKNIQTSVGHGFRDFADIAKTPECPKVSEGLPEGCPNVDFRENAKNLANPKVSEGLSEGYPKGDFY